MTEQNVVVPRFFFYVARLVCGFATLLLEVTVLAEGEAVVHPLISSLAFCCRCISLGIWVLSIFLTSTSSTSPRYMTWDLEQRPF